MFKKHNIVYRTAFLISLSVLLVGFSSCATQKSKSEAGWLKKFYHNVTAKYNGYFNANEIMKESMLKLKAQNKDNYTEILNVYDYVDVPNPQAIAPDMDKAMKKVSVVVNLHRISHWTDDCYLLLGQAQYLKHDYESAQFTFQYMAQEFNPLYIRNKKASSRANAKERQKENDIKKKELREQREKEAEEKRKVREDDQKAREKERKLAIKEREEQRKSSKSGVDQRRKERNQQIKERQVADKKAKKAKEEEEAMKKMQASIDSAKNKPLVLDNNKPQKSNNTDKKEGEKQEKPPSTASSYFLKHRPAYQEGLLWLSRTYIERQRYGDAISIINKLVEDPGTFKDVRREAALAKVHWNLRQKQYEEAIAPIDEALLLIKDKRQKSRLAFIKGQILQKIGKYEESYAAYEMARKYKPDFNMEFRSRLNGYYMKYQSGKSTAESTVSDLNKMAKENKNLEYRDQIYYTIAQIQLKNNQQDEAISSLKSSVATGGENKVQKTESYYQLARLYFETENYIAAKAYYDSTGLNMTKEDKRMPDVERYSKNLTEIANNSELIKRLDSLLVISKMSDEDKKALAKKIKKDIEAQLEKAQAGSAPTTATIPQLAPLTRSTFFAYDAKSVRDGKQEFERIWGDRKLEDNWRRSKKSTSSSISGNNEEEKQEKLSNEELGDLEVKKIFAEVPSTPEEIKGTNDRIMDAMYVLGELYRDKIQDYDNAVKILEKLLDRYPATPKKIDAYYMLYINYLDLNNKAKADYYKNLVLKEGPNSKYARSINDPDYYKKLKEDLSTIDKAYAESYNLFNAGLYDSAYTKIVKAQEKYGPGNRLQPKFSLLLAMITGYKQGKDQYIDALQDLVAKYPNTPEEVRAKEIIRLLGGPAKTADTSTMQSKTSAWEYAKNEKAQHVILVVLTGSMKLSDAMASLADYNTKYHSLENLKLSSTSIGQGTQFSTLVVRSFNDKALAMKYIDTFRKNGADFNPDSKQYEIFAITQENFQLMQRKVASNSFEVYKEFYKQNYQ